MAAPRRWRNIAAALAAAGLAAAVVGVVTPPAVLSVDGKIGAVVFGLLAALMCGVWASVKHAEVRTRDKLARGEDVIARWRVDADTWQRFVALETKLRARPDAPTPEFRIPETSDPRDRDVVVGRGAVQVGDELYDTPERGTPEIVWAHLNDERLKLAFVELCLLFHPTQVGQSPEYRLLRFPIADGSLAAARTAVAHFARETPQRPDFMHGPGDGSDPEDLAKCWKCGFETHKLMSYCPKCGATMQSRRWSRRAGVILIVLGLLIAGGMGALLAFLWPTLTHPGIEVGGSRFTGTKAQANTVIGILAGVGAFGLVAIGYGAFQLATGRRSLRVVQWMLGLIAVVVAAALLLAR